jgi:hypothetical protein
MIAKLQISDLHLGDPRSTLSYPDVAAAVVADVARLSDGHVGTLIVAGDAHEESVPGDMTKLVDGVASSVAEASASFFGELFKQVRVDRVVVVPGNHDLCTWDWYCKSHKISTVTPYGGVRVSSTVWPWGLLYPGAPAELTFAYPLYCDEPESGDYPIHVVTHGHLLDPLVLGWDPAYEYAFLDALGCRRPNVPLDGAGVQSVKDLASRTLDFVLALWKRYSPRNYDYSNYVMRRLTFPQSCPWQTLLSSCDVYRLMPDDDEPPPSQGYLAQVPWLLQVVVMDPELPTPVGSLRQGPPSPAFTTPSCLSFGHDHLGIFTTVNACGVPFAAADSGGWTSEHDGHLPHSHALVWDGPNDVVPHPYFFKARSKDGGVLG